MRTNLLYHKWDITKNMVYHKWDITPTTLDIAAFLMYHKWDTINLERREGI